MSIASLLPSIGFFRFDSFHHMKRSSKHLSMVDHVKGEDMWGFIFHAARGLMTPVGLLMVLQTPVVSGAGDGNREIREGRAVSNVELLYQLNWATRTGDRRAQGLRDRRGPEEVDAVCRDWTDLL